MKSKDTKGVVEEEPSASEEDLTPKKEVKKEANKPKWVKLSSEEIEKIIVDLAKKGESPAKIGMILRDTHGVPKAKLFGKRISKVLKDKQIKYEGEKEIVKSKVERLNSHVSKNKQDHCAKRSLTKTLWVVNKLNKLNN